MKNEEIKFGAKKILKKLSETYNDLEAFVFYNDEFEQYELVINSVYEEEDEFVKTLKSCNVPVWSEIELGYKYSRGDLIAVTGTNGKTTTTALGTITGSCLPFISSFTSSLTAFTVSCSIAIDGVGFIAAFIMIGEPSLIPPKIPPDIFVFFLI